MRVPVPIWTPDQAIRWRDHSSTSPAILSTAHQTARHGSAAQAISLRQRLSVRAERPAAPTHRSNPYERIVPMTMATLTRTVTAVPDYAAIKQRQQATWATGDYAVIGTTLQIVGERICEAVDLRAGERVLDVAAGNGNATLAAARRFAQVTSTDYVSALLERGKERAAAERLPVTFQVADAEALPFADGSFDVALSTFGVMFTPDQETSVAELSRVVRRGGRIGFANWTPDGFIGQLFKTLGK